MNLTEEATQPLIDEIARALAEAAPDANPVVLASMDVRRVTRHLLTRSNIYVPVLSYQELAPEFNVQPLGALTKGSQPEKEAPDAVGQSAEQRLKLGAGCRVKFCRLRLPQAAARQFAPSGRPVVSGATCASYEACREADLTTVTVAKLPHAQFLCGVPYVAG